MGKAEIAHYEQFLLFPQYFQKTFTAATYKPGLVWERVKKCHFSLHENEDEADNNGALTVI